MKSILLRWSTNWGHYKLKLRINTNQVKCWFLRRGETGVPGENHICRWIWELDPG